MNIICWLVALFVCIWLRSAHANIMWQQNLPQTSDISVLGSAMYTSTNEIELVTNLNQAGAIWWRDQQTITNGFEATINFTLGPSNDPPTYFSFVVQGNSDSALGAPDGNTGILFKNNFAFEIGILHVCIYGTSPAVENGRTYKLGCGTDSEPSDLSTNGGPWSILIKYDHANNFFSATDIDNDDDARLKGGLDITQYVNLTNGKAWIGFTASSGSRSNFVPLTISSLNFTNFLNPCESNNCSQGSTCSAVGSSYTCVCASGYYYNGTNCTLVILPGTPLDLTHNSIRVDSAVLSWTAATNGTYPIALYLVQIYVNSALVGAAVVNSTTYVLTDLNAYTKYSYQVQAIDVMGNKGPFSSSSTFQTPIAEPPQAPSVTCTATPTTVTMSWKSAVKGSYDIANYTIYFQNSDRAEVFFLGSNLTMTVTDLLPDSTYFIHIIVFDVKGLFSQNQSAECLTPSTIQPFFKSMTTTQYTINERLAVNLSWSFIQGMYAITSYLLTVTPYGFPTSVISNDSSTTATFVDFVPDVSHTFNVTAFNDRGQQSSPSGHKILTIKATDIPACSECNASAPCVFVDNSYSCTCEFGTCEDTCADSSACPIGFVCNTDASTCVDFDECTIQSICGDGFTCINMPGSYTCIGKAVAVPELQFGEVTSENGITGNLVISWNSVIIDSTPCNYTLELSIDRNPFIVLLNGSSTTYNFSTKLIPVKYLFRVSAFTANQSISNVSEFAMLGCMDGNCSPSISENCTTCPQDCCTTECSLQCNNRCEAPYSGPTCSHVTTAIKLAYLQQFKPDVTISVGNTVFELSLLKIAEVEPSGNSIRNYTFGLLVPNSANETTNGFEYIYQFDNRATLNMSAKVYLNGTTIEFAKQEIIIAPNSLKLTLTVANWNFASVRNTLQITAKTSTTNQTCGYSATKGDHWITISSGDYTFFAKFARNGLVDGVPALVGSQFKDDLTILEIPHFWYQAVLDPDYSVLFGNDNNTNSDACNPKGNSKVGLYVGVPVAIVLVLAAIFIVFVLYRQNKRSKLEFQGFILRSQSQQSRDN